MTSSSSHIVLLNKAFPPWLGGIEKHVFEIGQALTARGWKVTALVCNNARFKTDESLSGIRVIRVPRYGQFLSQPLVTGYYRILQDIRPALVHVHVPFPLGWKVVSHLPDTTPLICTWHSDIVRQRFLMPLFSRYQNRFLQRCNQILVTSFPLMEHSSALKNHQDRCTIVPLAIPPLPVDQKEEIDTRSKVIQRAIDKKIILFVGRLVGYKGLMYLVEAMQQIDAVLLVAGEGPLRDTLQKQVHSLGLASKVRFLGTVDELDKQALYKAADVFVLPSITRNEAFGYVLLEAMTQGTPVISTDLPTGVQYVNQHEQTGLIVPPKDADALARAITTLLDDDNLRHVYAVQAQERIERVFDFGAMIDRIEQVYHNALGLM